MIEFLGKRFGIYIYIYILKKCLVLGQEFTGNSWIFKACKYISEKNLDDMLICSMEKRLYCKKNATSNAHMGEHKPTWLYNEDVALSSGNMMVYMTLYDQYFQKDLSNKCPRTSPELVAGTLIIRCVRKSPWVVHHGSSCVCWLNDKHMKTMTQT